MPRFNRRFPASSPAPTRQVPLAPPPGSLRTSGASAAGSRTRPAARAGRTTRTADPPSTARKPHPPACPGACPESATRSRARCSTPHSRSDRKKIRSGKTSIGTQNNRRQNHRRPKSEPARGKTQPVSLGPRRVATRASGFACSRVQDESAWFVPRASARARRQSSRTHVRGSFSISWSLQFLVKTSQSRHPIA